MIITAIHLHFFERTPGIQTRIYRRSIFKLYLCKKLKEYDQQRYFQKITRSLNVA